METMLYASAQRQIQKAIGYCGLKQKTKRMALIIIGQDPKQIENELLAITKSLRSKPDHSVLEITARKESKIKRVFRISEEELKIMENGNHEKAVANLVIERVALLATIV